MPKTVSLFRVFIASPSDCVVERKIARQVVENWNIAQGSHNGVMLEAVLWESHSHPEMGERPQAVINRQILDSCDMLVAVFRSTLGSPTGKSLSGTVEEIERFNTMRKPILLYFLESTRRGEEKSANNALTSFKLVMQERGLWASYRGHHDFQMKLTHHLALFMSRTLGQALPRVLEATAVTKTVAVRYMDDYGQLQVAPGGDPLSALRNIRDNTTFLWPDFQKYSPMHAEFKSELRQTTFSKIKPALEALVACDLLRYQVDSAYRLNESPDASDDENSLILYITISGMTTAVSQLILQVSQE